MNEKGLHLAFEALLSLIFFTALLVLALPVHQESLSELLVMQKTHDVLKVWNLQNGSSQELVDLMELSFPGNAFEIKIDGQTVKTAARKTAPCYVFTGNIYNQLSFKQVQITLYL